MKNNLEHIDYIALISKYLAREATGEEIKLLEEWVLADEKNKATFNDYKKTWRLSAMANSKQTVSVDDEWKNIQQQLFPDEKSQAEIVQMPARKRMRSMMAMAATLLVLIVATFLIYNHLKNPSSVSLVADNDIVTEQLPDGTTVTLNNHSILTYPEKFKGKKRTVQLEGDAFFEVKRNEQKPFVIRAQNVEIEVLGTSFYVDAHAKNKTVAVTVKTGKVAVRAGNKEIILTPGEKGIFDKTSGHLKESNNEDKNFIAWKTKHFEFDDSRLEKVVATINAAYHSQIVLKNPALKNCHISVTFDNKNVDAMLDIIKETLGLSVEKQGEKYLISGKGCE